MRKKLKKIGSDGLMIYFTKEEIEMYGLVEGDVIDLDDMIIQEKRKKMLKKMRPFAEYFCECGEEIPRGYGYTLGHPVRCNACGRVNQRGKDNAN